MINASIVILETQSWLDTVVIQLNFCPFAHREMEKKTIRYIVDESDSMPFRLESLIKECRFLDENTDVETSLIIFPSGLASFDEYLDFYYFAEELLDEEGYEGIYQIASFHPEYQFTDTDKDDPANYTNRSPYPMLHLLRESSLENAISNYPNPEQIPERNCALARKLGLSKMEALLKACYQTK